MSKFLFCKLEIDGRCLRANIYQNKYGTSCLARNLTSHLMFTEKNVEPNL